MSGAFRPVIWVGSSLDDLKSFTEDVRLEIGYALYLAQIGMKAVRVKPMEGFRGASVLKIVDDYDGRTFRAVYTVAFSEAIYVLHCFEKKSKRGIATDKADIELVIRRFKAAAQESARWKEQERKS